MRQLQYILAAFAAFVQVCVSAQNVTSSESFELQKQGSHYVFAADVNGKAEAVVLLESGIPAMLVDSSFVFGSGALDNMELVPTKGEKINLGGAVYVITHKAEGTVKLGEQTSYRGGVFVLSGYARNYEMAVPVQGLHNDKDNGSCIVRLVLEDNCLQMLSRTELRGNRKGYSKTKLNTDTYLEMPAVRTKLVLDNGKNARVLKGNFNVDFGNPELVFLMHQHKDVQKFLTENTDLELRQGRNPRGEVVAEFLLAESCQLCEAEFSNAVILITKALPKFTATGNIGLKFFKPIDVIFDFDRNMMYQTTF